MTQQPPRSRLRDAISERRCLDATNTRRPSREQFCQWITKRVMDLGEAGFREWMSEPPPQDVLDNTNRWPAFIPNKHIHHYLGMHRQTWYGNWKKRLDAGSVMYRRGRTKFFALATVAAWRQLTRNKRAVLSPTREETDHELVQMILDTAEDHSQSSLMTATIRIFAARLRREMYELARQSVDSLASKMMPHALAAMAVLAKQGGDERPRELKVDREERRRREREDEELLESVDAGQELLAQSADTMAEDPELAEDLSGMAALFQELRDMPGES